MRRRSVLALIAGGMAGAAGLRAGVPEGPRMTVLRLASAMPRFGGFSALHLDAAGMRALLLSDRGVLFEAQVTRDVAGTALAVTPTAGHVLRGTGGRRLPGYRADSEAIAVGADGTIYIGFEGQRGGVILAYPYPGATATAVPVPREFAAFGNNTGIESLAIDRAGALYVIPEDAPGPSFPIWRGRGGAWARVGALPRSAGFLPVAADFGPDGALWVLERRFLRHGAFGSRLRRARRADLASWATILQTPDGLHGNLEGLSLWRDGAGRTRAAMVADDNFRWLQRNEFVEYVLDV